jgi:iron(III) transport system substrate-binding protein
MARWLLAASWLWLAAAPAWLQAQDRGREKEWEAVLAAAKKEGKVVVAGSPDPVMRAELIPRFTARYGIPVEFIAGRSSETVNRVKNERAAGLSTIDVFLAGPDTTVISLYGDKLIDPLKPMVILPEVLDGSKWKKGKVWFVDPEERFVVRPFSSVAGLLFINADVVKPDEIRSSKDLLNPKWRGKISAEDPMATGSGSNLASRFLDQLGPEFVKRLYVEQKPFISRDRRQFTDGLARGTHPICLNCRADDVRPFMKEGVKIVEFYELTDMPPVVNASPWMLTVGSKLPNPNAAKVFVNWLLSKEGLEIYSRGYGSATLRTDVDESFLNPNNIPKSGVRYFDDSDFAWTATGRRESRDKVQALLKELR